MKLQIRCAAIGATAVIALAGCQGRGHEVDEATNAKKVPNLTLQAYSVPADRSQSIENSIDSALGGIDVKLFGGARASITSAGPGKLLVYAPRDAQASIGNVIETLAKTIAPQTAPLQVGVHFWVIDGQPGAGADDPALKNLAGSLASLQQSLGPLHFHLDQAATLVGVSNQTGSMTTADGSYRRVFDFLVGTVNGDTARLQLGYQDTGNRGLGKLHTEIDATFGQYLVLAMAPGACPTESSGGIPAPTTCRDKPALRLLVVRVDRLPAKA